MWTHVDIRVEHVLQKVEGGGCGGSERTRGAGAERSEAGEECVFRERVWWLLDASVYIGGWRRGRVGPGNGGEATQGCHRILYNKT